MMDIKKNLKRIVSRASVYFTFITAFYTLMVITVNVNEDQILLSAAQVLFNFLFSVLASVAQEILRIKAWHTALRVLSHYAILLFAFYTCFLLPAEMGGSQIFVGIVAFTALYAAIMGIGAWILARFRSKTEQNAEYVKQYEQRR